MPLAPLLLRGDCLVELARIPDASIDALVTDPPYGLSDLRPERIAKAFEAWLAGDRDHVPDARGFMGRAWDAFVPPPAVWDECLRILKPGGHLLAFAGSRTQDLMGLSIRLAGFEIRDSIAWLYGSGFPKSMDVAKAITAHETSGGSSRVQNRRAMTGDDSRSTSFGSGEQTATTTATSKAPPKANLTDSARAWEGWGTALKPAHEPIIVARKPLAGTVAANVLAHGTGALNIDATRIHSADSGAKSYSVKRTAPGATQNATGRTKFDDGTRYEGETKEGRWPANVVLDESQAAELDAQAPRTGAARPVRGTEDSAAVEGGGVYGRRERVQGPFHGDIGGASRFFYVAKAPKSERPLVDGVAHPTVKPLALMRWLVRLVTPPGGVVVDPFAGSGTTGEAAYLEGFESILCEMTPDFWPLIEARIARVMV